jgi:hypothetical protein
MGFIFGDGGASKKQAQAITESSQQEAAAAREAARGDVLAQQTLLAQDRAAKSAEELLSRPTGEVDVSLQSDASNSASIDPSTGKRRTKRASYGTGGSPSGIQI